MVIQKGFILCDAKVTDEYKQKNLAYHINIFNNSYN